MKIVYFSIITVVATWVLLVIGGLVNPMGASMACPDWYFVPTCNGELMPEMIGGVLYEHGHRLWASLVGLLMLILAISIWVSQKSKALQIASLGGVLLVAFQGTLGGVTVLLGLNAWISTLHLICAMIFFCLLIWITFQLYPAQNWLSVDKRTQTWLNLSLILTLFQIIVGGLVRHFGAGLACGDDWLTCGPSIWPSWHLGQLHMIHRLIGYALVVVISIACIKVTKAAKKASARFPRILSLIAAHLVIIQILLGIMTVATVRSVPLVALHTAIGALLLGTLALTRFSMVYRVKQTRFSME